MGNTLTFPDFLKGYYEVEVYLPAKLIENNGRGYAIYQIGEKHRLVLNVPYNDGSNAFVRTLSNGKYNCSMTTADSLIGRSRRKILNVEGVCKVKWTGKKKK